MFRLFIKIQIINIKMQENHKLILYHSKINYEFDFYFKKYYKVIQQLNFYNEFMNIDNIFEMIGLNN